MNDSLYSGRLIPSEREWRNGLDQDYRKKVLAAAGKHTYTLIEIDDCCKTHVHIGAVANEY